MSPGVPRLNGMDSSAPSRCTRCNENAPAFVMSFFNTDWICLDCEEDEKGAPGYGAARFRELEEVKKGNPRFEGVGLDRDDWAYLMAKMEERRGRCSNS